MSRLPLFLALLICALSLINAASVTVYSDAVCTSELGGGGGLTVNGTACDYVGSGTSYFGYKMTCNLDGTGVIDYAFTNSSSGGCADMTATGIFDGAHCIIPSGVIAIGSIKVNCNSAAGLTIVSSLLIALVSLVMKLNQLF